VFDDTSSNAKIGGAFKIKPVPDDVSSDLRDAVMVKKANALSYCDADELIVKKQDGSIATPGDSIAAICSSTVYTYGSTWDNPIHVIAPRKEVEAKTARGTCFVDVPLVFGCSSSEENFLCVCVSSRDLWLCYGFVAHSRLLLRSYEMKRQNFMCGIVCVS
jgi:hypothetical protein